MSQQVLEHPTDEVLTEYALGKRDPSVQEHCEECPACSRYVNEMREVREALESLPETEPPAELREKVLSGRHGASGLPWYAFSVLHLLRSPFAVGTALVLFLILLYIFLVFVL